MQITLKTRVGIAAGLLCLVMLPIGWGLRKNSEVHTATVKMCGTPGDPLVQTTGGLFTAMDNINLRDGRTYHVRFKGGWGPFAVLNARQIIEATEQPDNNVRC